MPPIRFAIIGATGTAYKRTIPAIMPHSCIATVSAIQGRDLTKLQKISTEYTIVNHYTTVSDMLQSAEYDAIFVATPPFLHAQDVIASIAANAPVLCEKPIAQSLSEAHKIISAYQDRHTSGHFRLAHHMRHQPAMQDIRELLQANAVGQVTHAWIQWGYQMDLTIPKAVWKTGPNTAGNGAFADNGIHIIDLTLFLFGNPISVMGNNYHIRTHATADNQIATLQYDTFSVVLHASQSTPYAENSLTIYGTHGSIKVQGGMGEHSIQTVTLIDVNGHNTTTYKPENLYQNEIEDFACMLQDPQFVNPGTTLDEAMAALRIVDALTPSSE